MILPAGRTAAHWLVPGSNARIKDNVQMHFLTSAPAKISSNRISFRVPAVKGKMPAMEKEISTRVEKLESHFAHLERQVEELNAVVVQQVKTLERLKKEVQRQSSAMQTLELERIKANVTKPPHYQ
jgi:uncharacterized coiled-coil protein SlyX